MEGKASCLAEGLSTGLSGNDFALERFVFDFWAQRDEVGHRETDRQTDKQTSRTDRQIQRERKRERQTDRQTDRHTDRQTHRETEILHKDRGLGFKAS